MKRTLIISLVFLLPFFVSCTKENGQDDPPTPLTIEDITLSQSTASISLTGSLQLKATVTPSDTKEEITWSSSSNMVAEVSSKGVVKPKKCGKATITATCGEKSASCTVMIYHLTTQSPAEQELYIGKESLLSVNVGYGIPGAELKWSTSDSRIATVAHGNVRAELEGTAEISVRYLSESLKFRIKSVDMVAALLPKALKSEDLRSLIWSSNVALTSKKRIVQSFDITDDGEIYYAQLGGGAYRNYICYAKGPNVNVAAGERMEVIHFGHGSQLIVEKASDGTYVWFNTNGTLAGSPTEAGTQYENNYTFSRFRYEYGNKFDTASGYYDGYPNDGETYTLGNDKQDQQMSIDFHARRMLVSCRHGSTSSRDFYIYDLDQVLALGLTPMEFEVEIGNGYPDDVKYQKVKRKIQVHDLGSLKPLSSFYIARKTSGDPATTMFRYGYQGHQIRGNYVYFYEGWYKAGTKYLNEPDAYVTIMDYSGNILSRNAVKAVNGHGDLLEQCGISTTGYAEGESLQVRDDAVYLEFGCHSNGEGDRRPMILKYDLNSFR